MIDVMVVEDSAVVRELLVHVFSTEPGFRVVAAARDGQEALEALQRCAPHVITMDIHMPRLDGLEATRRIMSTRPTPIVVVSASTTPEDVANTFEAIQAGAVAVLPRPEGPGHPDHSASIRTLVQTVRLMSEIKVVRRWARRDAVRTPAAAKPSPLAPNPVETRIVALGASTGGPPVLQTLLAALPRDFPAPVLIVQHIAAGFVRGFVEWLAHSSNVPVHLAEQGTRLHAGHAYVAPDDYQMGLRDSATVHLTKASAEHGLRPSVSFLFRSVAECCGRHAIAGLLSGMGRDGAQELLLLRRKGAVTFVQDAESSVVHGMPGEALRLDAASLVLAPDRMAPTLANLARARGAAIDVP